MTDWVKRTQSIHVGDTVVYRREFLRNTGQYTGKIPFARGKVTALITLSKETTLAEIDWGDPDIPNRVNVANLTTIRGLQLGE